MHTILCKSEKTKPESAFGDDAGCFSFQSGFTMVELVTIVVILGIISAIALPRLFDRGTFESRGFYDQTLASLRYAQKAAISQHRLVCVTFPTTSRMVINTTANFTDVNCTTTNARDLQNPGDIYPVGQTTYTIDAPSGVTLAGAAAINFDALGRANFTGASPLTISVSGFATSNVCIAAETGYVYGC